MILLLILVRYSVKMDCDLLRFHINYINNLLRFPKTSSAVKNYPPGTAMSVGRVAVMACIRYA